MQFVWLLFMCVTVFGLGAILLLYLVVLSLWVMLRLRWGSVTWVCCVLGFVACTVVV